VTGSVLRAPEVKLEGTRAVSAGLGAFRRVSRAVGRRDEETVGLPDWWLGVCVFIMGIWFISVRIGAYQFIVGAYRFIIGS